MVNLEDAVSFLGIITDENGFSTPSSGENEIGLDVSLIAENMTRDLFS